MPRYIDAGAIEYHEVFDGDEFVRVAYGDDIDELPSADVVEVVRCKDCMWYEIDELKSDGTADRRYKPSVCILYREYHGESWFCADAIQKEGDAK